MSRHLDAIDTSIRIVTPENISFEYRLAGPFRRLPAYLIDVAIQFALGVGGMMILMTALGFAGLPSMGLGLTLVLWFALAWFYGGLFETLWNGQTPGKRLMRIRVISVDGQPITPLQAILRNALRIVDGQPGLHVMLGPFTYQVGLWASVMNDRFQRLGDLVCGTMVVIEDRQWLQGVLRFAEPEVAEMGACVPANFQASRTLARALSAYVQRRPMFSWARRLEIAQHVGEPLREKFRLPPETNLDLLLCAVYHRTFVADQRQLPERGGSLSVASSRQSLPTASSQAAPP